MSLTLQQIESLVKDVSVNRQYNCPGLAGSSKDGKTVYIDSRLPNFMPNGFNVIPSLVVHEVIEKIFEDAGLRYPEAHKLATDAERVYIESKRGNWKQYETWMNAEIRKLEKYMTVPPDLELKPERDLHERGELKKIHKLHKLRSE